MSRLIVGGITPSRIASRQKISSTPPLAPSRWPNWLFVLEMLTLQAWSWKTVLMAMVSAASPSGVLVPWALM